MVESATEIYFYHIQQRDFITILSVARLPSCEERWNNSRHSFARFLGCKKSIRKWLSGKIFSCFRKTFNKMYITVFCGSQCEPTTGVIWQLRDIMKNVLGKGVACGKQSYFQEIKFCPTGLTQSPSFSKCQLGLVVTRTDLNKSAKLIPGKTRLTSHQGTTLGKHTLAGVERYPSLTPMVHVHNPRKWGTTSFNIFG